LHKFGLKGNPGINKSIFNLPIEVRIPAVSCQLLVVCGSGFCLHPADLEAGCREKQFAGRKFIFCIRHPIPTAGANSSQPMNNKQFFSSQLTTHNRQLTTHNPGEA
jgi:hypothetical protein